MSPARPTITLLLVAACAFVAIDVCSRWSEQGRLDSVQSSRDGIPKAPEIDPAIIKKAESMTSVGALSTLSEAAKAAGIQGDVTPVASVKRGGGTIHRVKLSASATRLGDVTKLAAALPPACLPSSLRMDSTGSDGRVDLVLECEVLQLDP
jgi:hypothetical protein